MHARRGIFFPFLRLGYFHFSNEKQAITQVSVSLRFFCSLHWSSLLITNIDTFSGSSSIRKMKKKMFSKLRRFYFRARPIGFSPCISIANENEKQNKEKKSISCFREIILGSCIMLEQAHAQFTMHMCANGIQPKGSKYVPWICVSPTIQSHVFQMYRFEEPPSREISSYHCECCPETRLAFQFRPIS